MGRKMQIRATVVQSVRIKKLNVIFRWIFVAREKGDGGGDVPLGSLCGSASSAANASHRNVLLHF